MTVYNKAAATLFTPHEVKVMRRSLTATIDLHSRYLTLRPEDDRMRRKQARIERDLPAVKAALAKLK